jgi:hypothetical protein
MRLTLQAFCWLAWAAGLSAAVPPLADDIGELDAGPAYARFHLTLDSGWREEAAGPFFYSQLAGNQTQWALPPFFSQTLTPEVDWSEWNLFYPVVSYRRFGKEYRLQIAQFLSFSGGDTEEATSMRRLTIFPFYFQQRSSDTNLNYTALLPFYGELKNRLFRDDIKFVMFPLYSETRKKDVVTDNYLYPVFDRRRGDHLTGWQVWPLAGAEHKAPTLRTNSLDEVETVGGYDNAFALWPICFKSRLGLGTTNPAARLTVVPFYSQTRSPSRDESCYGWPLGLNLVHDREKDYVEQDFLWPLFVRARGTKNVTRCFPFYSRARSKGVESDFDVFSISKPENPRHKTPVETESDFYAFPIYKFNRLQAPPLDRRRTRVLYLLYSDTVERNTESHDLKRRVDFWPFYTYERELDGNRRLQVMAILEPFFPNNRTMPREYSPLWAVWRSERNARTGATSQSLLWNLYRHESAATAKKTSLLFGLFQYQSTPDGRQWRVCYLNVGKKRAQSPVPKA